jgi:hypothetical protein
MLRACAASAAAVATATRAGRRSTAPARARERRRPVQSGRAATRRASASRPPPVGSMREDGKHSAEDRERGREAGQMRSEERRERGDDQDDARGREHAHRDVPARRLNRLGFRCRRSASGHDVPDDEDEQHDRERLRCGPVDERQRDRGGGERSRPRGRTPPAPRSSAVPPAGRRRDVRTGAPRGLLRRSGAA